MDMCLHLTLWDACWNAIAKRRFYPQGEINMTTKIDQDLVRSLATLLDETGLGELEYEVDGLRVRVARPMAPPAPGSEAKTLFPTPNRGSTEPRGTHAAEARGARQTREHKKTSRAPAAA